jgi:hypothetical protein
MNLINKFLLTFLLLPLTLLAQNNVEGSKDHPLITRFPGSTMIYYDKTENGSYEYTLGPLVKASSGEDFKLTETRRLIGTITRIQYRVEESDISKVVNYYDHSLKANGFEITAVTKAGKPMEVAGKNWTLNVFKDLENKEKSNITGTKTGNELRYYIAGHLHRMNSKAYFAMVINEFDKGEIYVHIDIIGTELNLYRKEVLNAEQIAQNINEDGYSIINGIYFKPNSSEIQEEDSNPALEEVAKYLKINSGIILYVVGHTGIPGNLDYQLSFSKNMAEAVIKVLAAGYNINPERLIPEGVGPLSPITTNQNLEGRNINHRIEIVLKSL